MHDLRLRLAPCSTDVRQHLLRCRGLDWGIRRYHSQQIAISPSNFEVFHSGRGRHPGTSKVLQGRPRANGFSCNSVFRSGSSAVPDLNEVQWRPQPSSCSRRGSWGIRVGYQPSDTSDTPSGISRSGPWCGSIDGICGIDDQPARCHAVFKKAAEAMDTARSSSFTAGPSPGAQ